MENHPENITSDNLPIFSSGPSLRGAAFKENVVAYADELMARGKIKSVERAVRYSEQFYAPIKISLKDSDLVVFSTTTARSDRIKSHQWDAWGIKSCASRPTKFVLVLPDVLKGKEVEFALKEKERLSKKGYISIIDAVISLSELSSYIKNLN